MSTTHCTKQLLSVAICLEFYYYHVPARAHHGSGKVDSFCKFYKSSVCFSPEKRGRQALPCPFSLGMPQTSFIPLPHRSTCLSCTSQMLRPLPLGATAVRCLPRINLTAATSTLLSMVREALGSHLVLWSSWVLFPSPCFYLPTKEGD